MSYQQLTEGQRYQLSVLRAQGMSILATARAIGVHRSTLYRELRRNAGPQGYQPDNAHQHATHRRASAAKSRLSADVIQFVELTLAWWWSPEQISVSIHRNSIDTGKMRRSSLDPTFLLA